MPRIGVFHLLRLRCKVKTLKLINKYNQLYFFGCNTMVHLSIGYKIKLPKCLLKLSYNFTTIKIRCIFATQIICIWAFPHSPNKVKIGYYSQKKSCTIYNYNHMVEFPGSYQDAFLSIYHNSITN